ncbi:MAG: dehypoxanthine futalosine cyclase [Candidatus Scalindua sp.]|jgi:cyclic dehypoxanthinyl futalosine synthase|nr:dehypoxanthine futalosine cyclase [Candidatus Scalindua sp.]MBT5304608.1 dehypoxanthine futalosine cyclase [Candidatus Scalindua sp.]MBT6051075.1 dehypoxanthine futalosine cyclase [Candidatus Scalindua sp.]MBT6231495.1 dehypoxanthine futalosine cyclase [Candidatus Scalindua sp.]MBT7212618.1 dehypoxanthine futalosine cyclase [Candidatus Scalindua sp.]
MNSVIESICSQKRLSFENGVNLIGSHDLIGLGTAADRLCQELHPEQYRTYIVDRNINYTNVCTSGCTFCAFYKDTDHRDGYVLSKDEIFKKIEETISLGGTQILMQGGLHPDLKIDYYVDLLKSIKEKFDIHIHSFSPPEIMHLSALNDLPSKEVLVLLKNAGLDTIPGGGAEILTDRCRGILSPHKCSADEWLQVMREAHMSGIKSTATMMFGHVETLEERIVHLEKIRQLQDETGGFTAFIPWTFQPKNTALSSSVEKITGYTIGGFDYLKTLAVSRLFLDNVPNIQASWVTQGSKIAQLALKFGANDLGSTMIEENVVRAAGVNYRLNKEEMILLIEDLGFEAMQRDCYYNILKRK